MKRFTVIAALAAAFICSVLVSRAALADGKMMIYPYKWRQAPPLPQAPVLVERERIDDQSEPVKDAPFPPPGTRIPLDYEPPQYERSDTDSVKPEYPANFAATYPKGNEEEFPVEGNIEFIRTETGVAYETFQEVRQRAVIAWNGYEDDRGEETLILTTDEVSKVGGGAMLSILPLPGEPIEILVSDREIIRMTKLLLYRKFEVESHSSSYHTPVISPHNIFVLKLDNLDSFKKEVAAYVAMKYNYKAAALIDQNTEKIIKAYFNRGFRYFAFDLTMVSDRISSKQMIVYRFKSKYVYYPLQICGVGGDDSATAVDLIVMTPGDVVLTGAVKVGDGKYDARVRGKYGRKSVIFTIDEVRELDPALASVFKNNELNLKVRYFYFEGKLNGYNGDFTAKSFD